MAMWANLPSELATSVLYELDPARYKTTYELWSARNRVDQNLLNCTYVSRQFRAIIEPLLYRKVHLPVAWKAGEDQISFRNVQQFTRTLVLRPELGKHVRELDIPCLDADYDENDDISTFVQGCNTPYEEDEVDESLSAMSEPARGDLQQILPALARLGINNGLLLRGGGNGLLLVLLHLLPKLQKLELIARSELEFIAYSCFAAFVGGIPAGLSSISELTLGYEDTENGFRAHAVIPFISLPSLAKLSVFAFAAEDDGSPWLQIGEDVGPLPSAPATLPSSASPSTFFETPTGYALPARSSPIKNLVLGGSVVSCSVVSKLLTIPLALERFEYGVGGATVGYEPFHPAEFLPGLLAQAASLKELVIDTELMDELGEEEFFMGSLSGLVALETLRVPARLLLSPSDGEGAPNGQDESGGTTVSRNPIDGRLPRTLITLQLGLDWVAFDSFCKRTGLPKSLHGTRQKLPSLINLTIGGGNRLEEPILQEIMRQMPALQPPINATFFGVKSLEV